jgi:hypothetical protein
MHMIVAIDSLRNRSMNRPMLVVCDRERRQWLHSGCASAIPYWPQQTSRVGNRFADAILDLRLSELFESPRVDDMAEM